MQFRDVNEAIATRTASVVAAVAAESVTLLLMVNTYISNFHIPNKELQLRKM